MLSALAAYKGHRLRLLERLWVREPRVTKRA